MLRCSASIPLALSHINSSQPIISIFLSAFAAFTSFQRRTEKRKNIFAFIRKTHVISCARLVVNDIETILPLPLYVL